MLLGSIIVINSLSFDLNIYCLWVGLVSSEIICVYKYLKRVDVFLGIYVFVLLFEMVNIIYFMFVNIKVIKCNVK